MSNFNEENQDEEDIEDTSPISSQDALLAIEKTYEASDEVIVIIELKGKEIIVIPHEVGVDFL
ncbi:7258_t:CDS:2 [Entrophospora sp. SA101]|nr:7258_t:CDS:2 [Entrophospora sp. SA101]